ncbi:MAG: TAXI family TRAP transporter solute-binding subunit [Rhizobiaceae bacterium]
MLALVRIALVLLLPWVGGSQVNAAEFLKSIMTGGSSGTYIQIGRDLAELGRNCGYNLDVVESAGSLENLVAVKRRTNTQFGIVQSDVLEYVRTHAAADPELKRSLFGVRIMYPLYNEEVHLLARRDIQSVSDLANKRVAIGKVDSGTYLTSSLVLDIMRLDSAVRVPIGASEALAKLQAGEIDALFYVAGAPTKLFNNPDIDASRFHLVGMRDAPLTAAYVPSQIAGGLYPFQKDPVDVIAVKAVLMTYDFDPRKNAYHKNSCKAVADVASSLLTNFDALRSSGHPKWNDVDLGAVPPGWRISACVKQGMAKSYELECRQQPIREGTVKVVDQEYLNLLKSRLKP